VTTDFTDYQVRWLGSAQAGPASAVSAVGTARPITPAQFERLCRRRDTVAQGAFDYAHPDLPLVGFVVYRMATDAFRVIGYGFHPDHPVAEPLLLSKLTDRLTISRRWRVQIAVPEEQTGFLIRLRDRHGFRHSVLRPTGRVIMTHALPGRQPERPSQTVVSRLLGDLD
jgi:hypothetical protein